MCCKKFHTGLWWIWYNQVEGNYEIENIPKLKQKDVESFKTMSPEGRSDQSRFHKTYFVDWTWERSHQI